MHQGNVVPIAVVAVLLVAGCCSHDTSQPGTNPVVAGAGYAIAIGLNEIDPAHYGDDGALPGCEPDANDMAQIAKDQGFTVTTLLTRAATRDTVVKALADHASRLQPLDLLVVSYSGHGGSVPDQNGDETEGFDQTWCLYDGQLLDDELYDAWTKFRPGVRILVFSDSCHSGTILRMRKADFEGADPERPKRIEAFEREWKVLRRPALDRTLLLNDEAMRSAVSRDAKLRGRIESHPAIRRDANGHFEFVEPAPGTREVTPAEDVFTVRSLPPGQIVRTYNNNKAMYDRIGRDVPPERRAPVPATVLLISGCQDDQLSSDIGFNGLFTWMLKKVWDGAQFQGDHPSFHAEIKRRVLARNPSQAPNLDRIGNNPTFEGQRPYTK